MPDGEAGTTNEAQPNLAGHGPFLNTGRISPHGERAAFRFGFVHGILVSCTVNVPRFVLVSCTVNVPLWGASAAPSCLGRVLCCLVLMLTFLTPSLAAPRGYPVGVSAPGGVTLAEATKPNIVVILVDDMGFSDLGCYGSEIPTLNLDALAKNGVRFTQFYNTGRCCPTRAALLTGLYSQCATMAEVLKPAGYFMMATYAACIWHMDKAVGTLVSASKSAASWTTH